LPVFSPWTSDHRITDHPIDLANLSTMAGIQFGTGTSEELLC